MTSEMFARFVGALRAAGARFAGQLRILPFALLLVMIAALAAEVFPPFQAFDRFTQEQQGTLLPVAIVTGAIGFALFMGMTLANLLAANSAEYRSEFSFREIKQAMLQRRFAERRWRGFFPLMAGALLMGCGIFSALAVIAPLPVKVIILCAAAYAVAQISWGFARA